MTKLPYTQTTMTVWKLFIKSECFTDFASRRRHVQLSVSKDAGDSGIRRMNSTLPAAGDFCLDVLTWPAARRIAFHCSDLAPGSCAGLAERATRRRLVNSDNAINCVLYRQSIIWPSDRCWNSDDRAVIKSKQTSQSPSFCRRPLICLCRLTATNCVPVKQRYRLLSRRAP